MTQHFVAKHWPIVKAMMNNRLVMALTWRGVVWIDDIGKNSFSGHDINGNRISVPSWQIISYVVEADR